jgi:hypothetical protein
MKFMLDRGIYPGIKAENGGKLKYKSYNRKRK